jgi:hypothetical protein
MFKKQLIMKTIIITSFVAILFFSVSCKPNDPTANTESVLENFISVNIEMDTIHYLDTSRVFAHAVGENMVYQWQTSSNAPLIQITGIDTAVLFYADPCLNPGVHYVYCTVIAENREEMKMDSIVLTED